MKKSPHILIYRFINNIYICYNMFVPFLLFGTIRAAATYVRTRPHDAPVPATEPELVRQPHAVHGDRGEMRWSRSQIVIIVCLLWSAMAMQKEAGVGDFVLMDTIDLDSFMRNLELRYCSVFAQVSVFAHERAAWQRCVLGAFRFFKNFSEFVRENVTSENSGD